MNTALDYHYENANLEIKRKLIGSIFPEKLVFEDSNYRTAQLNEVLELIINNGAALKVLKKELADISTGQSSKAPPPERQNSIDSQQID